MIDFDHIKNEVSGVYPDFTIQYYSPVALEDNQSFCRNGGWSLTVAKTVDGKTVRSTIDILEDGEECKYYAPNLFKGGDDLLELIQEELAEELEVLNL